MIVDKTFDAAANIIDSLPVSQQDGAFNIFDIGQRFVLDTIHTLVNQITGIINNIVRKYLIFFIMPWLPLDSDTWSTTSIVLGLVILDHLLIISL